MTDGIEIKGVSLVRRDPVGRDRIVLNGVSAMFPKGSLSLITGPVGAGKSTLLHVSSTLLRPTSGEVLADGQPVSRSTASHRDRWRRRAGIAMQSPHFLGDLTALENIMAPLIPVTKSIRDATRAAMAQLDRLGVAGLANRDTSELSGGERARVTLARALVASPEFLFVDEPTAHQDADDAGMILSVLAEERARGAMVIVVSHDPAVAAHSQVDSVLRVEGGKVEVAR